MPGRRFSPGSDVIGPAPARPSVRAQGAGSIGHDAERYDLKGKRLISVCAFAVLVAIGVATYALWPREPVYQGKKLSEWLEEADIGVWPRPTVVPADEAIRQIGTNALPMIAQLLRARDSALKRKLLRVSYKVSFIGFHITAQNERHSRAITGCWALGPAAKPLVPELATALSYMDPYFRPAAEQWLGTLGADADAAVPALIAILRDRTNPTREIVPQTLGKISWRRREEVIPVLKECLKDTNQMVRFWAENALNMLNAGDMGAPPKVDTR